MAVERRHDKKSPTQNPNEFFRCDQQGGKHGMPTSVPDKLASGPMREQLMGNPNLSGSMDPSVTTKKGRTGGSVHEGHGVSEKTVHPVG